MSNLIVKGIAFQSLPHPLFEKHQPVETSLEIIIKTLAQQVDQLLDSCDIAKQSIERHFLCSTMIELPFTSGQVKWQTIADQLGAHGNHQPDTFVNAYECASWGYSLRYYLKQGQTQYLIVTILDANLYGFEFWRYNEHWENSGFGIATVILEVKDQLTNELMIGSTTTHNPMAEFATVVRRIAATKQGVILAMPFFPQNIQEMFTKLLGGQQQLPDLHADWGHCFGSDPWLSLLNYGLNNKITEPQHFMTCSYALNGYYALADVMMMPDTQLILNKEWEHD